MSRVSTANIAYLVKGALQPRSSVDMTKLTGPFDRNTAAPPPVATTPKWDGMSGGEVAITLGPDEYIALEIDAPLNAKQGLTHGFGNVLHADANSSIDLGYSATEGDFAASKLLGVNSQLAYFIVNKAGNPSYYDVIPGTKAFCNVRVHGGKGGKFMLRYQ